MGQKQPLPPHTFQTVVLDGSGNGTASIGPVRTREHWQVDGVSVQVNTNVLEAICSIYMGGALSNASFVDSTYTGSTGDICGVAGKDIQPGMLLWAQWKGGDPGSTATMTVIGTYSLGAPS